MPCVVDNDMSLGSRVAESKVGRVGKPSHQMMYYVITKLHESGIQLQTKQHLCLCCEFCCIVLALLCVM